MKKPVRVQFFVKEFLNYFNAETTESLNESVSFKSFISDIEENGDSVVSYFFVNGNLFVLTEYTCFRFAYDSEDGIYLCSTSILHENI